MPMLSISFDQSGHLKSSIPATARAGVQSVTGRLGRHYCMGFLMQISGVLTVRNK